MSMSKSGRIDSYLRICLDFWAMMHALFRRGWRFVSLGTLSDDENNEHISHGERDEDMIIR